MGGETVLVTGGSGFVGAHCLVRLLDAGYQVRASVRSPDRVDDARGMVRVGGTGPDDRLTFAVADLTADDGWAEAVEGCDYVLHVAAPLPPRQPTTEDDLVTPARDGALRVLRAARAAGVRRVVLTSSFAAVGYGHPRTDRPFEEEDWSDLDGPAVTPHVRSTTLAERAAWDFAEHEGDGMELAVVNPVGVFGPVLGPNFASSIDLVRRLLAGELTGVPHLSTSVVDVRDVADLHLRAMIDPAAAGERFLAAAGEYFTMPDMARALRARLGDAAARVPKRIVPNWVIRVAALTDRSLREITPQLGRTRRVSNAKARRVLGWSPRSNEDTIVATAESLIRLGLLSPPPTR
ncbi:SDR family oxidoreductase [Actinokineospora enzanensis]|uniref:SDR family oxidoreductase n=1 Tax=Actinokineospora enzanensis TaxID=155975 RepID=UPI0003785798|nr:aldehyde reductase [Actinokineospora enzanensis]